MATNRKGRRSKAEETKLAKALEEAFEQKLNEESLPIQGTAIIIEGAQHNAAVAGVALGATVSNPMEYIDELAKANPFWANVALRVLASSVGYYAVNSILWEFRKRNQKPEIESTINWYNDEIAQRDAQETDEQQMQIAGHSQLAFVRGEKFLGAYKYLMGLVMGDPNTPANMELPTPAVLYDRMRQKDKDRDAVLAEYEKFENVDKNKSPNMPYLKARMSTNSTLKDIRQTRKAQAELDHIHLTLHDTPREVFTDEVWAQFPLWAQFRLARSVYNQVIAALANEDEKPSDERMHRTEINAIGEVLMLELQMADRTPEVKLAFERKVLKEQHALLTA